MQCSPSSLTLWPCLTRIRGGRCTCPRMLPTDIGGVFTQVPQGELDRGALVEDMTHEPLSFGSGTFKRSPKWWATMDKDGFATVSIFKRLEYLLWNGVHIYTNHRNSAYIFDPETCVSSVAKTAAQCLDQWKAVLGQYYSTIMHIAGDRNCWGDLLSRWVTVSSVSVCASGVHASSEPGETLPSNQAIRNVQQASRATLGTLVAGATCMTDDGQVPLDDEGLFRLQVNGRAVLWIPGGAKTLQVRLICLLYTSPSPRD